MKFGTGSVDGIPFQKALGSSRPVGKGALYTYTIYIEPQIGIRRRRFVRQVQAILADERSWIGSDKVAFQRVEENANTQLILAHPDTVDRLCYPLDTEGKVSCCQGTKVVVNVKRWRNGVEHWPGPVKTYRQMLINHEFGHRIGKGHRLCPAPGYYAPVMQQQTYGLQGCEANSWPLASEL